MGFDMNTAKGAQGVLYKATLPTLLDGDVGPLAGDSSGRPLPGDVCSVATIHASGAEGATITGPTQTNLYGRGGIFTLDITAHAGSTPTLDVKMQVVDAVSGKSVDVPNVVFAQKNSNVTTVLQVIPNIAAVGNLAVSSQVPYQYCFVYTIGGTGGPSFTFTLSVQYLR